MVDKAKPGHRLLFVVAEDWAFLRHRLPMAQAALAAGYDVGVATQIGASGKEIEALGFRVFAAPLNRTGLSPFADLRYLLGLWKILRDFRPDLMHNVSAKPILFGTLAGRLAGVPKILNAFTGMGILFMTNPRPSPADGARRAGRLLLAILRWALRSARIHILVQNKDDLEFVHRQLCPEVARTSLIPGSGVDTEAFAPTPEPEGGPITVTLVGRLLWTKGVGEFVEAARILHDAGQSVRMVLVGAPDPKNPTSVSTADLTGWVAEGLVEWSGELQDIAGVWAKSHIAVLPSHREGLPKSLLEAAACGRPLIATDVPGCRELVDHEETGLLCPPGDPARLADAIARLLASPEERRRLGAAARRDVEQRLSADVIGQQVVDLYGRLLATAPEAPSAKVQAT